MNYSLIVAYDNNKVIGDDKGNLPFDLKEDLKNFKKVTMGKIVIMGRKTYESLPIIFKGRTQIILSRDKNYKAKENDEIYVCSSIEEIESLIYSLGRHEEEVIIMGGGEVYRQFFAYCNKLYITEVLGTFDGTVKFPEWDEKSFNEISKEFIIEGDISYNMKEYIR